MENIQVKTKFCKFCGSKIPEDAVMCTHCERQVEKLKSSKPDNIIINNSSSSSASASNINQGPIRKKHSILFDDIYNRRIMDNLDDIQT